VRFLLKISKNTSKLEVRHLKRLDYHCLKFFVTKNVQVPGLSSLEPTANWGLSKDTGGTLENMFQVDDQ
jgi:hypothetical protein